MALRKETLRAGAKIAAETEALLRAGNSQAQHESIFSRLREIQFDGPTDLSVNHDLYVTGEKRATERED